MFSRLWRLAPFLLGHTLQSVPHAAHFQIENLHEEHVYASVLLPCLHGTYLFLLKINIPTSHLLFLLFYM